MKRFTIITCGVLFAVNAQIVQVARGQLGQRIFLERGTPSPLHGDDTVDNLYIKGNAAQAAGNFKVAITYWDEALKINPKDAVAMFNRANARLAAKAPEEALADAEGVILLTPKDPDAYALRGRIRLYLAENPHGKNNYAEMMNKSVADYREEIRLRLEGVEDVKTWLEKRMGDGSGGTAQRAAENSAQSVAYWSEVTKVDPTNAAAWYNLARSEEFSAGSGQAILHYTEAVRLDPKNVEYHENFANLWLSQDDWAWKHSLEEYDALVKIDPSISHYERRANMYEATGQDDKALEDFNTMISNFPTAAEGYRCRGQYYIAHRQWDKAITDLTEAIRITPRHDIGCSERALAYLHKKEYDKAIEDFTMNMELEKIQREPVMDAFALILRADAYARKGAYGKAAGDFTKAVALDKDNGETYDVAAWFFATCPDAKIRSGEKAARLAQRICEVVKWKYDSAIDTLAAAKAELGQWDEAVKYEKQAIQVATEDRIVAVKYAGMASSIGRTDVEDDEKKIKAYGARLLLYQQKKPCRQEKDPWKWEINP